MTHFSTHPRKRRSIALATVVFAILGLSAFLTARKQQSPLSEQALSAEQDLRIIDAFNGIEIRDWKEGKPLKSENLVLIHAHASPQDSSPRMPQLEVYFDEEIREIPSARLVVDYVRGNGKRAKRRTPHDLVKIPSDGNYRDISNGVWRIHEDPDYIREVEDNGFFGGDALLIYKLPGSDTTQSFRFRIGGQNPEDERCKEYITNFPDALEGERLEFMYAVAKHESKHKNKDSVYYNQFLHLVSHPNDAGYPTWNNDGGQTPGGYGVFQVTGTDEDALENIPRNQIWNWQANVDAAFAIMTHQFKDSLAKRYFERIKEKGPKFKSLFQRCPPPKIKADDEVFTAKQAIWITAYNGWGGLIKNRFIFQKDKPCGLGPNKRWNWKPPIKPSGKTYLQLVAEEME